MPKKGGAFEREISKTLSLWWTNGEDDDCFWRSSQSGGRATVRRRKGKGTRGHCGDICSTSSDGEPLTRLITFELKKGYAKAHVGQLLDRPKTNNQQEFEEFLEQAITAASNAGTPHWAVIHKRDLREACIYFPMRMLKEFEGLGCDFSEARALFSLVATVKLENKTWTRLWFVGMPLWAFLNSVDPQDVRILQQRLLGGSRRR